MQCICWQTIVSFLGNLFYYANIIPIKSQKSSTFFCKTAQKDDIFQFHNDNIPMTNR